MCGEYPSYLTESRTIQCVSKLIPKQLVRVVCVSTFNTWLAPSYFWLEFVLWIVSFKQQHSPFAVFDATIGITKEKAMILNSMFGIYSF